MGTATILAAGKGSRLLPLTDQLPKCMLDIQGKSMISRACDAFQNVGIESLVVVGGYQANKLELPTNTKLVINDRYDSNNILHSLSYARSEMQGSDYCIVSYSDIIFRESVVQQLVEASESDISIVVDQKWGKRYQGRTEHPLSQCETAQFDKKQRLLKSGKNLMTPERDPQQWGEFIGMMKLTQRGNEIFWNIFDEIDSSIKHTDAFQSSATWYNAYLTDMLQELVDREINVHCTLIQGGWLEIDTNQDYQTAKSFVFNASDN